MSPAGTKKMGDLIPLHPCAPKGLKFLFPLAEGVIQRQIQLLGSGTPSKAPDLQELLRGEGIAKPENQSEMLDRYNEHKDEVNRVKDDYKEKDGGIPVKTAEIGKAVTDAYDAIETSVGELNKTIKDANASVYTVTKNGEPVLDANGNEQQAMPKASVDRLFNGLWDTLDKTYGQVTGVSDQAAAQALKINRDEPAPTNNNYSGLGGSPGVPIGGGSPSSSLMSDDAGGSGMSAGSGGPPLTKPEGEVAEWINEAIKIMQENGVPVDESDAAIIATMIEKESSGNPHALNDWDSNWEKGTPSKGIMQCIDPTFDAHSLPGHKDIWNPVDNIIAGTRYAISRYGSLENTPGMKSLNSTGDYTNY
ncbi:transglycosylase SLT domain-containing protein [Nocardia sp. NPDC019395]|uniref:transglycosylase SLT domain-containing protein n=1 Tax=Nocardia sp. NPDC019395 TaxID=3154686 RepID=UPI0033D3092F